MQPTVTLKVAPRCKPETSANTAKPKQPGCKIHGMFGNQAAMKESE
jgi:hypothetical protein